MKYLKLFTLIVSLCLISCKGQNCNKDYISNYLIDYSEERNYNYCELVNQSLENDSYSIRSLSLLEFYDGMTYEHGAVIIEIINKIGEEKYLKALNNISPDEKVKLKSYLHAGFDFTQNVNFKDKNLKTSFNKVYAYLGKDY